MQQPIHTSDPVIIIPAYQPGEALLTLVREILTQNSKQNIIIVDDGSAEATKTIFDKLRTLPNVIVLQHAINLGKGQALKTAFNYYLLNYDTTSVGVVTADADGQHSSKDIEIICQELKNDRTTLVLGSRSLNKNVPLRSRFGNTLTRKIFHLLMRKPVHDTQTGLRGIPRFILPELLQINATRYEYELDMLIRIIRKKIAIKEIPIETIYIDDNKSSHFNPILDSLKVYFVFIRYIAGSISSAVVDFVGFVILNLLTHQLFFSIAGARVISGTFNFFICKKMIFKSGGHFSLEAVKYLLLAIFSLGLSYILVLGLSKDYGVNLYLSKIIADISVFLINFTIQKVIIFPMSQSAKD